MELIFNINYNTANGEAINLCVDGSSVPFKYNPTGSNTMTIDRDCCDKLDYSYSVTKEGETIRKEWGSLHSISLSSEVKSLMIQDRWQDISPESSFFSSLFTKSIFKRENPKSEPIKNNSIMVSVVAPIIESCQTLVLVGGCSALGDWNVEKAVRMNDGEFPLWKSPSLEISDELLNSEYKFAIIDSESGKFVDWEDSPNRKFNVETTVEKQSIYILAKEVTFNRPKWRGTGVAIPLFSIRTENSMGVGEFLDLKPMSDWVKATGQKIIQILPINDSTMKCNWEDSYPYNANSIFALHPQYISPMKVGTLKDSDQMSYYIEEGKRLNALDKIDYEAVNQLKDGYMRKLYSEIGSEQLLSEGFKTFFAKNSYWLEPYALFSHLRTKYRSVEFSLWGSEATYSKELQDRYCHESSDEYYNIAFYYFMQYNLHLQLVEAREYARTIGVAFKGDIPIGVSRTSVDVWVSPSLFRVDSQAGAPPDDFSVLGQNWGFPTYNWSEMAKDGYSWWYARFRKMAEYFDAYRIDHILGFFRIWEIPLDAIHGLLGHFSPAMPYSVGEMSDRFEFTFDKSMAEPDINEWLLLETFDSCAQVIAAQYFDSIGNGKYNFKEQYNSQVKLAGKVADGELRDKLLFLFNELLFIEDPYKKGLYHPRISAQKSFKFRALPEKDKERYNNLYNHFYYHRHNQFWGKEAMEKLPTLISATNMLTCGEDLGMIPDCVPEVMESQQILSLEIQRMPKNPSLQFGEPWNYPYRSVCTTSTHDMNPIRAWLLEDKELSERFIKEMFDIDYKIGDDIDGFICEEIIKQHTSSPAMWTILPLQDWLSISETLRGADPHQERINVPASSRHYWRYRMHCTVESLLEQTGFNDKLLKLNRHKTQF